MASAPDLRAIAGDMPGLPERYTPVKLLGEGATGSVWRAKDRMLGTEVAVKIVRANLAVHKRFRARFAREVALSARVVHPRLVPVYDWGRLDDGRPFVAMAWADAGSLADLLELRPPISEILRIMDRVLEALAALHAHGFVHQDLKPANVLLYAAGEEGIEAWVADLGVAAALAELMMDRREISGTPEWMAPEQLMASPAEIGPWTDLYAVGLMLHQALGGAPVSASDGKQRLLEQRRSAPLALPPSAPDALAEVVTSLLAPDPRQRYDRAADVRRALAIAAGRMTPGAGDRAAAPAGPALRAVTAFPEDVLPEVREAVAAPAAAHESLAIDPVTGPMRRPGVPAWNRVPPDPMTIQPPPEPGFGAKARGSLGLLSLREAPLVARHDLRGRLWGKAREVVANGEPQVVLVVGASGGGKSRLVESVARALDEGGWMEAVTLRYHDPPEQDDGYRGAVLDLLAPWSETREQIEARFARWLSRDWQVTPDEVRGEAAVLARWCGYVAEGEAALNAAVGLTWLYRFLDARAWRGGACLVLEDAHLAREDGDGLAICEALLDRSVGERPVLVMATISEEAFTDDAALRAKVAALESRGAQRLEVPPLTAKDVRRLLTEALLLERDLAEEVAPRCHGSPAFAGLLLRDWAVRGLLTHGADGSFVLAPGVPLAQVLPPDLDAMCVRRIHGALAAPEDPDATGAALAATALAGHEPPIPVVRAASPDGFDALLGTGLVRQQGWKVVFEHNGLRRVAQRMARLRPDASDIHGRLADAWERMGAQTGMDVSYSLGVHRMQGWSAERALVSLQRAARASLGEGRARLALESARLAVEAADRAGVVAGMVDTRCLVAEACLELDRPGDAETILDEARNAGHLDRRTAAHVEVLLARAAIARGQLDRGRKLLRSAGAAFAATRDRKGLIETAQGRGVLYRLEGRFAECAARYEEMLRLNRGDRETEINALNGMLEARIEVGQLKGLGTHLERLRELARDSGDTRHIARATYVGGLLHLRHMRLAEAERHFRTAQALASTLGADVLHMTCMNNLGEVARYRRAWDEGEKRYLAAARFAEERGWTLRAAIVRLNLALLALSRDRHDRARDEVARADVLLQQHPGHWAWMFVGLARALWAARDGDGNACRAWWAVANERGLARLKHPDLRPPLQQLADAAAGHGWDEVARKARELCEGIPDAPPSLSQ